MKGIKLIAAFFMMFIFLFSISGCDERGNDSRPVIKVGVVAVTSGELFRKGNYLVTAARYAADKINREGGILVGDEYYRMELIPADSGLETEIATKVATRLIEKDKVSAIVGAANSVVALALAEVCENYKVPFITPVAGTNQLTRYKYSFRVSYTNKAQGKALARFLATGLGRKSVGVLYEAGSPYSAELARCFKDFYTQIGGVVTACEGYTLGDRDYGKQLRKIIESDPQILFLPNNTKKVQLQAAQARKLGFTGILLGSDSWDPIELERNDLFFNSYYADHWTPGLDIEGEVEFENGYRKANGAMPTELEALTYDAVMSLGAAIKQASSTDSTAIHDGLIDMGWFHGITGKFNYNNNGDPAKDVIISMLKDGKVVVKDIIKVN